MISYTGPVVCVLAAVIGFAVLDPWYGASALGGAAVAGLLLRARNRRATPGRDGAERARETAHGLLSTSHVGGTLPIEVRCDSRIELATAKYMPTAICED